MTTACDQLRAPFPYFGGKRGAAPIIWQLLGDPGGYVEPFCGSAAALLARPGWQPVGWRRVETLNDADGWLVNCWRAIRHRPAATARWATGPITEIDLHAIAAYLAEQRGPDLVAWLEGHPLHCDPVMAGWWLRLQAAQLAGSIEGGPWVRHHGRLVDSRHATTDTPPQGQGISRELPYLGPGQGITRQLPHLGAPGRGIARDLPHPDTHDDRLPAEQAIAAEPDRLAARLSHVRITCGDWARALTPAAASATTGGDGHVAVLLDPPYDTSPDVYAHGAPVAQDVEDWCLTQAPPDWRILVCGYAGQHDRLEAAGWAVHESRATTGGFGTATGTGAGAARSRERLWASPSISPPQEGLF